MQSEGGEKIVRGFGGWGGRERFDELGDLGFVGIADNPGDAGEGGQLFGRALGVAAGDDEADAGVGGVKLSNGVAGLGVGRGCDGTGVDDDDVSGGGSGCGGAAAVEQLALEGRAIGLGGTATELFDEEGRHAKPRVGLRTIQHRVRRDQREEKTPAGLGADLYKDSGFGGVRKDR